MSDLLPPRRLEYMRLDDLVDADVNPKDHADDQIAASIGRFGFIETPVIDERTGKLVAGHGRRDDLRARHAAGESAPEGIIDDNGVWLVPTLRGWSSSSDVEAQAAGVALNRVGEAGGWKVEILLDALRDFEASPLGLDGIGFDASDLQRITAEVEQQKRTGGGSGGAREHEIRVPEKGDEITKRGDVWILGDHRVMCGDCRTSDVDLLIGDDESVAVAFTSPPYAEQRDYDLASGFAPIKPDEYVDWFSAVQENVGRVIALDGSWFVNIKPSVTPDSLDTELYVFDLVLAHVRRWGWHFATEFAWERNGVPKQVRYRFKNQYEPIYQFTRGPWKMRPEHVRIPSDNVPIPAGPGIGATTWSGQQGEEGSVRFGEQNRSYQYPEGGHELADLQGGAPLIVPRGDTDDYVAQGLAFPGNRLPTFNATHDAVGHAAAFPVGLPAWFLRAYSDVGDIVYDPFVGSGSTILAAESEHRRGRGIDLSPGYVDVTCARWQARTGRPAVLAATGEPHDFLTVAAPQP